MTIRLVGAAVCEEVMRSPDGAQSLARVLYVVSPDRWPYRQRVQVWTTWWLDGPDQACLRARLFSPGGELLNEVTDQAGAEGLAFHTTLFSFGQTTFSEAGLYRVQLVRDEDVLLEIPLFVEAPPGVQTAVETPEPALEVGP